jgi:hypothetical protein
MRLVMKRAVIVMAAFVACSAGAASAETINVKIPFPFVVQGRTLPAGQYAIERDVQSPSTVLIRGENGNKAAMYVMTLPVVDAHAEDKPALTFKRGETNYRLVDIWNGNGQGREVVAASRG